MLSKWAKSFILLAAMGGLLMAIGGLVFQSSTGIVIGLVIALALNFYSWFNSDKLAIRMAKAEPMDEAQYPEVYATVRRLADKAGQPMPNLFISPSPQLNAFATGRGPDHAAGSSGVPHISTTPSRGGGLGAVGTEATSSATQVPTASIAAVRRCDLRCQTTIAGSLRS